MTPADAYLLRPGQRVVLATPDNTSLAQGYTVGQVFSVSSMPAGPSAMYPGEVCVWLQVTEERDPDVHGRDQFYSAELEVLP